MTLVNHVELVARVARRFMPRLKTESEVATINYLRQKTNVPVPTIYHYDSNPYNRLGGEWILMSKVCFRSSLISVLSLFLYYHVIKGTRNSALSSLSWSRL